MKKEWILLILMLCVVIFAVAHAVRAEAEPTNPTLPKVPVYSDEMQKIHLETPEEALSYAKELCIVDYLQLEDLAGTEWSVAPEEDGNFAVTAETTDGTAVRFVIAPDGSICRFDNGLSHWQDAPEPDPAAFNGEVYDEWRSELAVKLTENFVRAFNPEALERYLLDNFIDYSSHIYMAGYEGTSFLGDSQFLWFYSDSYQGMSVRMKFVLQTAPVMRIVCYDAAIDAESEGGNG